VVDGSGLVTVRGNGSASISVRDNVGQTASFSVTITGVIKFFGLGNGKWDAMNGAASAAGGRLPNMAELREIHAEYASRWFMGGRLLLELRQARGDSHSALLDETIPRRSGGIC
jgi:hypothetical protein